MAAGQPFTVPPVLQVKDDHQMIAPDHTLFTRCMLCGVLFSWPVYGVSDPAAASTISGGAQTGANIISCAGFICFILLFSK